jgi:RNA polymerase sigma-70 factor (ECF subfamily)
MDLAAVEEIYRRYGSLVLRRARSILGDEQAARDAMQEVFVRALRSMESFRGEASPATWLYRVTTNYCLNQIRDEARRRALLAEQGAPAPRAGDPSAESRMTVVEVLGLVPEELREVAIYYYVDQMNQDEIAALLGVSRRTVGNRLEAFREAARAESRDAVKEVT